MKRNIKYKERLSNIYQINKQQKENKRYGYRASDDYDDDDLNMKKTNNLYGKRRIEKKNNETFAIYF